jgi:enoyl-[acyl-carrier protein] reductase II
MTKLSHLMFRGTEFLGTEHAILCGAMSWVSERNLVSAISNAGGFGVIACGAMTPELLDTEITATKALTDKPFGVNLITMHPMLFDLIAVCAKHKVGHVVLAGGIPPKGSVEAIKEFGGKVSGVRAHAGAGQEAAAVRRRCAGDRGIGSRRPHRPCIHIGAGAGIPA